MAQFTRDNTSGYSSGELAELNRRFNAAIAAQPEPYEGADDVTEKSWRDHVAEEILAVFDRQLTARGPERRDQMAVNTQLVRDMNRTLLSVWVDDGPDPRTGRTVWRGASPQELSGIVDGTITAVTTRCSRGADRSYPSDHPTSPNHFEGGAWCATDGVPLQPWEIQQIGALIARQ